MASTLETLLVDIRADTARLRTDLNRAVTTSERASGRMRSAFRRAGAALASIGAGFALNRAISGISGLASEAQRANNQLVVFRNTLDRFQQDAGEASQVVDRLSERFGVLPSTVREASILLLRAGGDLNDVEKALTAAGASAAATGFDISQSFENVAIAVATGRSELLETSGIIANLGPVTQDYAQSIGKTVDQLSDQELVQARVNAIYRESRFEIEDVDTLLSGLTSAQNDLRVEMQELRRELGERFLPAVTDITGGLSDFLDQANDVAAAMPNVNTKALLAAGGITAVGTAAGALITVLGPLAGPTALLAGTAAGLVAINDAMGSRGAGISDRINRLTESVEALTSSLRTGLPDLQSFATVLNNLNPFDVFQGQSEEGFLRGLGVPEDVLRDLDFGTTTPGAGSTGARSAGREGAGGGGGRAPTESDTTRPATPTPPEPPAAPTGGVAPRTIVDALNEAAAAGTRANQRALALIEAGVARDDAMAEALRSRVSILDSLLGELLEMEAGEDIILNTAQRLADRQRALRVLERDGKATPPAGLLQGGPGNVPGTLAPPPVQVDESEIQAVLDRIVRQAALDASAELQSRLAQQQGAPGAVQTADDLAAFNEELRDWATAEAEVAGALTEYEQEVRAAAAGVATVNARLADIEATRVVVDRILAQARISADPTLQARLGQQQGGPGAIQTTEGLAAFNEELRARAAQEAEAAGALTTYEQEVRNAAAGAIEFNEGLLEIEAREDAERRAREEVERLTRNFERLNRIASDPNLQARLAQQQGGPLPEGFATPEVEGTTTPEFEQTRLEQGVSQEERQRIEEAGIEASRKAAEIEQESAEKQRQAGLDFAESVINAGDTFLGAIQSFQGGDIGGGIAGLGQTAGSLISSIGSLAGSASLFGPIGSLVGAGAGLLGGIISAFTGDDDRQLQQEEARARSRRVPAININFTVNQDNNYQGGPQLPSVELAFRQQAITIVDEFMNRTRIIDRIEALEGAT